MRALEVARVTLRPGARYDGPWGFGSRVVSVETGAVTVAPVGTDGAGVPPPMSLAGGEHVVLPPSGGSVAVQTGPAPAVFLDIAVVQSSHVSSPAVPLEPPPQDGVTVEVIADELWVVIPAGPIVLTVGRVTLGPGERLGWVPGTGPALLYVEAGTLDVTATGPVMWMVAPDGEGTTTGPAVTLAAHDSALFAAGDAAGVSSGPSLPTTFLVVTLLPDDGQPPLDGDMPAAPES